MDHRNAGDGREHFVGNVALTTQPPALTNKVVDRLVAAERSLDRVLSRNVGAELHIGEHVETFDEVLCIALVARNDHPASAVAAGTVGFRE